MTRFTRNLRWAMCDQGLSSAALAERLPITWGAAKDKTSTLQGRTNRVRHYARGSQDPKLDTVEILADGLGIPPAVLAFGDVKEWRERE